MERPLRTEWRYYEIFRAVISLFLIIMGWVFLKPDLLVYSLGPSPSPLDWTTRTFVGYSAYIAGAVMAVLTFASLMILLKRLFLTQK